MSAKRKLVYNGHHGVEGEVANCLWCGRPTAEYAYVVNPGGTPVLKCCCEEHYRRAESFVERDARFRQAFYVLLAGIAIASWVAIGFLGQEPAWTSLPLVGFSLLILVWPRVLPRYEYYLPPRTCENAEGRSRRCGGPPALFPRRYGRALWADSVLTRQTPFFC